jgi:Putative Flp pilus-assembly TadE/G-like
MLNTSSYRPALTRLAADQRGVAGIVTAIAATVLLGFCGLAIDVVMWQVNQRSMQGAADQAALAAVTAYRNAGETGPLGDSATAKNGAYATAHANTSNWPGPAPTITVAAYNNGTTCTSSGALPTGDGCLQVTITQQQPRFFTAIFSTEAVNASASAVGTCSGCGNGSFTLKSTGGDPCVMALDASGSGIGTDIRGDVSLSGGAIVSVNKCNLYNNSPFTDATVVNNNSRVEGCDSSMITTTCSSRMFLTQSNNPNGSCVPTATTSCPIDIPVVTSTAPAPDPYGNLVPPTASSPCLNVPNPPTNVPSGTYCGGNQFQNQTITFATGATIVIIGGLDLHSGATILNGSGVSLYVQSDGTSSQQSNINASTQINITAPTSGPYQGVALWFGGSSGVTYAGSNGAAFQGAIYAPTANVKFAGSAGSASTCTRLVAGSITFTGGATANFDNSGCPVVAGAVLTASGVSGSATFTGAPMLVQ